MPLDLSRLLTEAPQGPRWVVEGMLPRGTLVVLAGDAGVGKSFLSYTLAFSTAAGLPFLGRRVEQTRVLYVDEENSLPDLQAYLRWVWLGIGQPDIERLSSSSTSSTSRSVASGKISSLTSAKGFAPRLIIVDTATSALKIQDENDNAEAARVISGLHQARAVSQNDATLLVLGASCWKVRHRRTVKTPGSGSGRPMPSSSTTPSQAGPGKTGLRPTVLEPDKVRAWGLREGSPSPLSGPR